MMSYAVPSMFNCDACRGPPTNLMVTCDMCVNRFHRDCVLYDMQSPGTWTCPTCSPITTRAVVSRPIERSTCINLSVPESERSLFNQHESSFVLRRPQRAFPAGPVHTTANIAPQMVVTTNSNRPAVSATASSFSLNVAQPVPLLADMIGITQSSTSAAAVTQPHVIVDNTRTTTSNMQNNSNTGLRRLALLRRMQDLAREEAELLTQLDGVDHPTEQNRNEPRDSFNGFEPVLQQAGPTSTQMYQASRHTGGAHLSTYPSVNHASTSHQYQPHTFLVDGNVNANNEASIMSRFMARQTMKVELPTFTGRPEEWRLFIKTYENTTQACGLSNEENLQRLQKSLKGSARFYVESLLDDPSAVGKIITNLRNLYGRPEMIINAQLEQLQKEPLPKAEKPETVIQFSIAVSRICSTMEATATPAYLENPILLQQLVTRLPHQMKREWGQHIRMYPPANIKTFTAWLEQQSNDICATLPTPPIFGHTNSKTVNAHVELESEELQSHSRICLICNGDCAKIETCAEFQNQPLSAKWNLVRKLKLCKVHLAPRHRRTCGLDVKCGVNDCQFKHHPLLHNEKGKQVRSPSSPDQSQHSMHRNNGDGLLFRILPVVLRGPRKSINTFAFLDEGSSVTLLEQSLAQELSLNGRPCPLELKWTGDNRRTERDSQKVKVNISGNSPILKEFTIDARTVTCLDLPKQTIDYERLKAKYPYLSRLPISSYLDAKPTLLIGLDHGRLTIPFDVVEGEPNEPIASKTRLGWCIGGPTTGIPRQAMVNYHVCECQKDEPKFEELVKEFFAIDSLGVTKKPIYMLTSAEKRAEEIMEATLTRVDGRYEVGLPWRFDKNVMPDSYHMALSRLRCLERKLARDESLKEIIQQQFQSYIEKGYLRELTLQELQEPNPRRWYLPVFSIRNPNKPKKVRLVWDAAAVSGGMSLNGALLTGLDLTTSMLSILLRFRERKIAYTADIEEMFHRIKIREEDQQSQCCLWRDCNSTAAPRVFAMTVMTFGATCSPYQSQYVKNYNAQTFIGEFPRAVNSIIENHYVDDVLQSVDTLDEAIQLAEETKAIHGYAGMNLRNFVSNCPKLSARLNGESLVQEPFEIASLDKTIEKVLGIFWDVPNDCITYSLRFNKANEAILSGLQRPTKRETLRVLMSIYDPPGLLAHFLVNLKIFQQDLWRIQLGWNDLIPDEEFARWQKWIKQLPTIETLRIPRCYLPFDIQDYNGVIADLHVFVDASASCCAAVAYIRIEHTGAVHVALMSAKTKTAPLKPISIPRLELVGALLGARLAKTIKESVTFAIMRTIFHTDSTTVLDWLGTRKRLTQFVAFRVGEIKDITDISTWRWVPTKDNVADEATKWRDQTPLDVDSRWFQGPSFLRTAEETWPMRHVTEPGEILEQAALQLHVSDYCPLFEVERFSKWTRLLRAVATVFRGIAIFIAKARKSEIPSGPLTSEELRKAESHLYMEAQQLYFSSEISLLERKEALD